MAVCNILQHPNPRLRLVAQPVQQFDYHTKLKIRDVIDTMYATENTAGLAATQIDIQRQIIAIDLSRTQTELLVLINPEILEHSTETTYEPEACLSVSGNIYEPVTRYAEIKFRALDQNGKSYAMACDGFLARCVQHEMDHLKGKLFIDYLSKLKRMRLEQKIKKWQKVEAA